MSTAPHTISLAHGRVLRLAPRVRALKLGLHHVGQAAVDAYLSPDDVAALRDALSAWLEAEHAILEAP